MFLFTLLCFFLIFDVYRNHIKSQSFLKQVLIYVFSTLLNCFIIGFIVISKHSICQTYNQFALNPITNAPRNYSYYQFNSISISIFVAKYRFIAVTANIHTNTLSLTRERLPFRLQFIIPFEKHTQTHTK